MKFILETKSNLFIDSGKKLMSYEYDFIIKKNQKNQNLNYIQIYDFNLFLNYLYDNNFDLEKLSKIITKKIENTKINIHFTEFVKELDFKEKNLINLNLDLFKIKEFKLDGNKSNKQISLFNGDFDNFYIPGSSIKGAFNNIYFNEINEKIGNNLIFRDTIPNLSPIFQIKEIFSFMDKNSFKKTSISYNLLLSKNSTIMYIHIEGNENLIKRLFESSKNYSLKLIEIEIKILKYYIEKENINKDKRTYKGKKSLISNDFMEIIIFLEDLKKEIKENIENSDITYLKIGKHTGWLSKEEKLIDFSNISIKEILEKYRNDKKKGLGVKAFSVDSRNIPFGWIKLTKKE